MIAATPTARNVALYPWFKFFQNLVFWQAIWFLFFQKELSGAEAILLYAIYDVGTTAMEVPSGYMSDRLGRRRTLIASGLAASAGAALIAFGDGFAVFALAQVLLGAGAAFASGTDNAFLYESLAADGREDETEAQETRSWQFSLIGLALSAFTGGLMAQWGFGLAFAAGAAAQAACFVVALRFCEPPHEVNRTETAGPVFQARLFQSAMRVPVLVWLFTLSVLMYGFSHIPFVFWSAFHRRSPAQYWIARGCADGQWRCLCDHDVDLCACHFVCATAAQAVWTGGAFDAGLWHSGRFDCHLGRDQQHLCHRGFVSAYGAQFIVPAIYHRAHATVC